MTGPQRSVIVPIYNGRRHLPVFWRSLVENSGSETEIIVVDDGSEVPVRPLLRHTRGASLKHIRNRVARGFAAAVNDGIAAASAPVVCVLNSDLILEAGSLDSLCATVVADPEVGVAAAKLLYPQTGRIQHAGIAFTATNHYHLLRHGPERHPLVARTRAVQAVAFAACAFRRDVLEHVGLLDSAYVNGYEDLDYCFRLHEKGYRTVIDADATAFHWERQSGSARSVLRKDNVARLWGAWGGSIRTDLFDYLREMVEFELCGAPRLRAEPFTIVNLSRGSAARDLMTCLSTACGVDVEGCWDYNQRRNDDYQLWIPLLLPVDAARHRNAFIYLVDELPQLEENHYWFALRCRTAPVEIIVDHNANVAVVHAENVG